jgi:hypothetical protein
MASSQFPIGVPGIGKFSVPRSFSAGRFGLGRWRVGVCQALGKGKVQEGSTREIIT